MIQVKNLTKRYGDHLALDNISFKVDSNTVVGFLGPNGAGKSTTMNIITGYLSATDGEVSVSGIDILENPLEAKQRIGYLPEIPPLYADMTVNEYLGFACELKGIPEAQKDDVMEDICKMTRIQDVRRQLIEHLSKGYRQRVGLAQALIGNPDVIVLDEPTVGLDPKQIIEMRELIRKLGKDHTVFLSSHILSEIESVCDQIIIINNGRIVATDTPDRLAKRAVRPNRIEVRLRGSKNIAQSGIMALPGVKSVELLRVREEGTVDIAVETLDGMDVREELFKFCVEKNMPILMMKTDDASLEDIFLQMTENKEVRR